MGVAKAEVTLHVGAGTFQPVRTERVDVALDLGGFTVEARRGMWPMRPAPVVMGWLAYAGSSGHRCGGRGGGDCAVHYQIADRVAAPAELVGRQFSERVVLLRDSLFVPEFPASRFVWVLHVLHGV